MIEPDKVIDALVMDRNLVLRFFATFSRFEYSLKRSGFLKHGNKAEPNWDEYATSLRAKFLQVQDSVFQDAVAFLLKEPPKTQVVSEHNLDWKPTSLATGEDHETYVLRVVRTVRNNLFHGGKFPTPVGAMEDVGRNRRLLEASILVLHQCLQLCPKLRAVFEETA